MTDSKLKEILKAAFGVAYTRVGDVDTIDGTVGACDIDSMIELTNLIEELTGLSNSSSCAEFNEALSKINTRPQDAESKAFQVDALISWMDDNTHANAMIDEEGFDIRINAIEKEELLDFISTIQDTESKAASLFSEESENELCLQLLKMCEPLGFDADSFDSDHAQIYCMIQMAAAFADKLTESNSAEWVAVSERLPKEGQKVWYIFKPSGNVFCGKFEGGYFMCAGGFVDHSDISYWMPCEVPKPPTEDK